MSNDSRRVEFAQEVVTDDQEDGSMYAPDQTMRVLIRDIETDTGSKNLQHHINVDSLEGDSSKSIKDAEAASSDKRNEDI